MTGRIHLMPERSLREALAELTGRFLPVTDATYWSDALGEARMTAELVAVNHERGPDPRPAPRRSIRGPASRPAGGADAPPRAAVAAGPADRPAEPTGWCRRRGRR